MTIYSWPSADPAFSDDLESLVWKTVPLSLESDSPLNGDVQTNNRPGTRRAFQLTFSDQTWADRRKVMAFLERLNGRQHRVSFVDPTASKPAGTIALSGVTVNAAAAQFAESVQLAGCGANATLLRGDWFKLGTQAVRCVADATANASGVMTVEFRHMLRASVASGSAVGTNNVAALYILADPQTALGFNGSAADPFSVDFIEVFS